MSRKSFCIPFSPHGQALMFSHRKHTSQHTKDNSAEQLSKCFFSALFSEAFPLCDVSWKELPGVFYFYFFSSLHHWTLWSALCIWTHAAQSPYENTTGYIWGGTLYRQEALLRAQTAKAAEVSFWHDETRLTTRYTWGFLFISAFVFVLLFLRLTVCRIF